MIFGFNFATPIYKRYLVNNGCPCKFLPTHNYCCFYILKYHFKYQDIIFYVGFLKVLKLYNLHCMGITFYIQTALMRDSCFVGTFISTRRRDLAIILTKARMRIHVTPPFKRNTFRIFITYSSTLTSTMNSSFKYFIPAWTTAHFVMWIFWFNPYKLDFQIKFNIFDTSLDIRKI